MKLLLTCEHGGNKVPSTYRSLFTGADEVLRSHRGWDPGALGLFELLKADADAHFHSTTSRLLVELNRSPHHPALFSRFTRSLPVPERKKLLERYYMPYRSAVEEQVSKWTAKREAVMHVAVHSFTPVLNGEVRTLDIGLLYDPMRRTEKQWAERWREAMLAIDGTVEVRMNKPYLGKADGFPTHLRKLHRAHYTGIELEVNQGHLVNGKFPKDLVTLVRESLRRSLSRT
ncbi:MAG: N-formylglutamate amidohydrolase [Flavobacteriales bacterium]|nr:N-formylglutamate amidohydrolase [Flavobacteriales bacterium]